MIRPATSLDIPRALEIYASARQFMRRSGNTVQWVNGYPSEALLRSDVAAGRLFVMEDAGGVYAVMKELTKKGLLDTSVLTCTGKTLAENLEGVVNRNPELIRPIENPYSADGGIAVLKGNLAPEGCVVKRSAVAPEMMVHEGPARVFDCEDDAIRAIYDVFVKTAL